MSYMYMKVYDSIKFPKEVRDVARKLTIDIHNHGNDSYFSYQVGMDGVEWYGKDYDTSILNAWLLENGGVMHEDILINFWW